ncbi:hypothetical protein DFH06DRAFT_1142485 [Mycena polygramma]|nr:hypothetical protein DFH06DRAFT_1142485 [Mycena polygramma]
MFVWLKHSFLHPQKAWEHLKSPDKSHFEADFADPTSVGWKQEAVYVPYAASTFVFVRCSSSRSHFFPNQKRQLHTSDASDLAPAKFDPAASRSSAAKGSVEHLSRLIQVLNPIKNPETWISCLPIFYANLDPAGIPIGEEPTSPELSRAVFALGALRRIKLSRALAGADLWPRIWQWIQGGTET